MTRAEVIRVFRKAIAALLEEGLNEMSDDGKVALAESLVTDPSMVRLIVALEPFVVVAALVPREGEPVELFHIRDALHAPGPSGATH